jgi:hypothetical protein
MGSGILGFNPKRVQFRSADGYLGPWAMLTQVIWVQFRSVIIEDEDLATGFDGFSDLYMGQALDG